MRRRPAAVAGALATAALAATGLAACGGDEGAARSGSIAWQKDPQLLVPETLPNDRILFGRIRNTSSKTVELNSAEVRLTAADGRRVAGNGRFVGGFVHGNIPLDIQSGEDQAPPARLRLGYEARIAPGKSVPLTVAWREAKGRRPVAVELGDGSRLEVPQRPPRPGST